MQHFINFGFLSLFCFLLPTAVQAQTPTTDPLFQQELKDLAESLQNELINADAVTLISEKNLKKKLTLNALRDNSVYAEEISGKAGNLLKLFSSLTYEMNSEEKIPFLLAHSNIDLNTQLFKNPDKKQVRTVRKALKIKKKPDCPTSVQEKKEQLATQLSDNYDALLTSDVNMGSETFRDEFLDYVGNLILLQAYAQMCEE